MKKKLNKWLVVLGCVGQFKGDGKFYILSALQGVRPPEVSVEFGEFMVVKVDRSYVYITGDSRWLSRVKKKNVKII